MYRLRKKSEAKRSQIPEPLRPRRQDTEPLPTLPPADDFRTSLILPDLTRRFSVLRTTSGTPIGIDDLKTKFAEQRARGSEHQLSEEEEDMILEALGRLHVRSATARNSGGEEGSGSQTDGQSARSSSTATSPLRNAPSVSSLSSAKGSNVSRRMSNNLFGSGKFRDQAYIRNANQTRRSGATRALSVTPSESSMSMSTLASSRAGQNISVYSDNQSLRPTTPEGSTYSPSTSAPSSPNKDQTVDQHSPGRSTAVDPRPDYTALGKRLSKTLSPEGLRRASLALDEVIKELEEEGDDEIVMERSPIAHVPSSTLNSGSATTHEHDPNSPLTSAVDFEHVTAVSSDDQVTSEELQRSSPNPHSRTTSPTPRLPGYIPGMPRPMTPRETSFDSDDQTPSTTPRATSPRLPSINVASAPMILQSFTSSLYRSNSNASTSRQSVRPTPTPTASTPPLFFNRSTNGRFTPEDRQHNDANSPTSEILDSPILGRRRPMSPLSGPAFQPLASSRPGTPSNVTWSAANSKVHRRNGSTSGHSRSGSTTSIPDTTAIEPLERSKSTATARSLRSPALPDSPCVDGVADGTISVGTQLEVRPASAMSAMELGSPLSVNRPLRSPTPTYNNKSPTSPTFPEHANSVITSGDSNAPSRRSSKQNQHSSFSLGSPHALLFSPFANSSRSSLESVGSSYHSWDEDHKKDRLFGLFNSLDPQHTEWHDISVADKSTSSTPGTSPYEGLDLEEAVRRQTGLTKFDFIAIQDKLVTAALTKAVTPEGRNRASSIRKRRPSTSQSNYSYNGGDNRVASPAPQPQSTIPATSRPVNSDHIAKASALLDSVVDSIEAPRPKLPTPREPEDVMITRPRTPADPSSLGRRHRALADALFGAEDKVPSSAHTEDSAIPLIIEPSVAIEHTPGGVTAERSLAQSSQQPMPSSSTRNLVSTTPTPSQAHPHLTSDRVDATQLAKEVQQRAEAATAALRKSPSIPKLGDGLGTVHRKRIHPNQISSPTLVSASTSVDTIPLQSTSPSLQPNGSNKNIGSRLKRLRGTLRAKPPVPNGGEVTPYPASLRSPPEPMPTFSATTLNLHPEPVIAARVKSPRLPVTSPPASAQPGLKGFMARFRKHRAAETYPSVQRQRQVPSSAASSTPSSSPSHDRIFPQATQSAPHTQTVFRSPSPDSPRPNPVEPSTPTVNVESPQHPETDEVALRQLFDAASNLGLDQSALNDLIARSSSTSSRSTAWTKLTRMTSATESHRSQLRSIRSSNGRDDNRSAFASDGRPSLEGYSPRPSVDTRHATDRKPADAVAQPRPELRTDGANAIVRRTIFFPSDYRTSAVDLNVLMRKQTSSLRRRSASAVSVHSTRSIHDRVPTPPPHKSSGARRFSADGSPPVPQLPQSISSQLDTSSPATVGPIEKSSSAYDSLYEMYAGDSRSGNTFAADGQGASTSLNPHNDSIPESRPALEVVELANGETIWSIVNGLRDDDGESYYGDRTSFVSDYSTKDSNSDPVKLFFKEHERKSSKGSNASFLSRKKHPKGSSRPETKVFFSSSAQIGRLIENMSRGMDAGSFNIAPDHPQAHLGHSTSTSFGSESDAHWTVEERLEQMLGSISSNS
ncbi:hypothetical protein BKA93DRAFT_766564 [Sparassis latifolia]